MLDKNITLSALIIFTLTLAPLFNAQVNAQDIIVTADRIKSTLDKSPADIKIIETEEIEKASSIVELLSKESDLKIAQSGPPGGNTSLFLRGSESSHVLVIIDGITMNDPSNPNRQFDLGRLSLNNVEKIEILKGSQGLLYGSNAIGGVILITTKKGKEGTSGSASADYGSFNTVNGAVNVQNQSNRLPIGVTSLSFGIDHLQTRGFSAFNKNLTSNADDDGEKRTTVSAGLVQSIHPTGQILLNYRGVYDKGDIDKVGKDDPNDYQNTKEQYLKAGYNQNWTTGDTQISYTKSTHNRTLHQVADAADPSASTEAHKGILETIALNHTLYTTEKLTQNFNFDYQHEKDELKRSVENLSFFFYNRYELSAHVFNFGLRLDNNQIFNDHLTYKVAWLYNFDPALLKFSYSTGFRAPSLNQLYTPKYGNKNLTPETSQTLDLGFEIPFVIHKYTGSIFYTDLKNRLSYDPATYVNQNRGKARIVGFENIFTSQMTAEINIDLSVTWLEAKDTTANQKLERRPNYNAKLSSSYKGDKQTYTLEGDFNSRKPDIDSTGNRVSVPSYIIYNFYYNHELTKNYSTYAKVQNILDKDYEDVYSYGTAGMSMTLGLKYIF